MSRIINALIWNIVLSLICLETLTSMHVFPATANDCILQTNLFGLVNRHIFRPTDRNSDSLDPPSPLCPCPALSLPPMTLLNPTPSPQKPCQSDEAGEYHQIGAGRLSLDWYRWKKSFNQILTLLGDNISRFPSEEWRHLQIFQMWHSNCHYFTHLHASTPPWVPALSAPSHHDKVDIYEWRSYFRTAGGPVWPGTRDQ